MYPSSCAPATPVAAIQGEPTMSLADSPPAPSTLSVGAPVAAAFRSGCCVAARTCYLAVVAMLAIPALWPKPAHAQDRSPDALHKLNESVDALIKKVSPSVVQ